MLSYEDIDYNFEPTLLKGEIIVKLNKAFQKECNEHRIHGIIADDFADIPEIYVDRRMMHVVIYNIYKNAIKYSDPDTSIYVITFKDKEWFNISVQSHGIEIADADKERIFEMWYRAPEAAKRSAEGLGLGLYHAREIVERHRGKIEVSTIGRQTTITICLPTLLAKRRP